MSNDLICSLRIAAAVAGPNARKLYLSAADEIERCHARLEIDHYFVMKGDGLVREAVPYDQRAVVPDKIDCLEVKIEFLEK